MKTIAIIIPRLILCHLFFQLAATVYVFSQGEGRDNDLNHLPKLDSVTFSSQDSAIVNTERRWRDYLESGDTISAINQLNQLSSLYCNRVNYDKSYDGYWKALLLADKIGEESTKADSYNGLAILYSLYERRDEALKYYLLALDVNKKLIRYNKLDSTVLIDNYFLLAIHYRYDLNVPVARAYLDSCTMVFPATSLDGTLVKAEYAYLLIQEGKFEASEKALMAVEPIIQKEVPRYLVILYTLMGDLYKGWQKYHESEYYYQTALTNADKYKRHLNYVPDIYEKLSELYSLMDKPTLAYESLIRANAINTSLYSSRSPNNRYLLEIKDDFRVEKEKQEKLANEQRLALLEQEENIWLLKFTILVVTIIFLLVTGFIIFRYWRSKHKSERRMLEQKQKMEAQKSREILHMKNKELTESALQLIEKDELLSELKDSLKTISKNLESKEVNKLVKKIALDSNNNWKEFESRFINVNQEFYDRLKSQYPNLSQYDLKVCALLKLNFTGKEMARLLGISPESAHTSRYRLRKKLGIGRDKSLADFIAEI